MALSLKLYFDIGKKTENLTDETVNSLLLSQRTAVNLEVLRFSLDIIANASEAERARDAVCQCLGDALRVGAGSAR